MQSLSFVGTFETVAFPPEKLPLFRKFEPGHLISIPEYNEPAGIVIVTGALAGGGGGGGAFGLLDVARVLRRGARFTSGAGGAPVSSITVFFDRFFVGLFVVDETEATVFPSAPEDDLSPICTSNTAATNAIHKTPNNTTTIANTRQLFARLASAPPWASGLTTSPNRDEDVGPEATGP